ncbi:MAG: hypothetical protein IJI45_16545 [Anaerolineaceae bacterium]|nr:hypothetical protein [Anaerolineaceae bacterium]
MKLITCYENGNAMVYLYDDGTKVRLWPDNEDYRPEYPESCDVTIQTKCSQGCPYCYLGCSMDGKYADFSKYEFLDHMHPGMELAINIQLPLHPNLDDFLQKMSDQGVIVNATVNQDHFTILKDKLHECVDKKLLYGIGVSYLREDPRLITDLKEFPNAIVHVIAGIIQRDDLEFLADHGLKLLVLGYKNLGRARDNEDYFCNVQDNINNLSEFLPIIKDRFEIISFDNLALEQLSVRKWVDPAVWAESYMGEEGLATFFLDLVNGRFAQSSLSQDLRDINNLSLKMMFSMIH